MASEGRYDLYRKLAAGRRLFVGAKLASVALSYWRGTGTKPTKKRIALIKGSNQFRHHRHTETLRENRIGDVQSFSTDPSLENTTVFPRLTTKQLAFLLLLSLRVLVRARKRDLSLYLLAFYRAARSIAEENFSETDIFICYNDQPFDIAAFVYALNTRTACKTVVIQHGLILSPDFYFPCHAREFWAWGTLSLEHFRTRHPEGTCKISGRYAEDRENCAVNFKPFKKTGPISVLIAFSFFHHEIRKGLRAIESARSNFLESEKIRLDFKIKLHPATKMRAKLRPFFARHASWLRFVDQDMESLAATSDLLITKNSTSAIDFLLLGKPVLLINPADDETLVQFQSACWSLDSAKIDIFNCLKDVSNRETARVKFLAAALNV